MQILCSLRGRSEPLNKHVKKVADHFFVKVFCYVHFFLNYTLLRYVMFFNAKESLNLLYTIFELKWIVSNWQSLHISLDIKVPCPPSSKIHLVSFASATFQNHVHMEGVPPT